MTNNNTSALDEILEIYQKKFPEVRKLFGLKAIVRTRDYFDGCLDIGWTKEDIISAINIAKVSKPWKIISSDKKKTKGYTEKEEKRYKDLVKCSKEGKRYGR